MPITLGCPSCGKRFRARDESAGKRVKCPFCQAAVPVPTPEEAASAGAPTETLTAPRRPVPSSSEFVLPPVEPPTPPPTPKPPAPKPAAPKPVAAAPASDWGASDPAPTQPLLLEVDPSPPRKERERPWPHRPPPTDEPSPAPPERGGTSRPKPARPADAEAVPGWRSARRGLRWVMLGLFFITLLGVVPFGKLVYQRVEGELPDGPGWVRVEGYVNADGPDVIRTTRREEIDAAAYGLPVLLGGFALVVGRLVAGGAPRASGAKGLFFFSGVFTLFALVGALSIPVCEKVAFRETGEYARTALLVGGGLAEFWFLVALGNAAGAVRRPKAARAVGGFALLVGLAYLVATVGWDQYVRHGAALGRPQPLDADWQFYEQAAKMLGWVFVVGSYWRAVGAVSYAVRLHIEDVEDGKPAR